MPSKYVVRNLKGNSYYHIYNKGIEGKDIFLDKEDYETFLYYIYIYTASPDKIKLKYPKLPSRLNIRNLHNDIFIIAYCLMPNHFHLILKQNQPDSMPRLLKQVINAYVTYFNTKYKKKGAIFSGRYKSIQIESEYLLTQMIRFVHLNTPDFLAYPWCSFGKNDITGGVMNRFSTVAEWQQFHEDTASYNENMAKIKGLTID